MNERIRGQRGSFGSGKHITFHQSLFDGEAHLYKITQSGEVYQFRMFIKDENKHDINDETGISLKRWKSN